MTDANFGLPSDYAATRLRSREHSSTHAHGPEASCGRIRMGHTEGET